MLNNDSGQDWGNEVIVSTQGQVGIKSSLPDEAIADVKRMALTSWAADRIG
ncbi:hypothetical protein [Salinivibrio sp. IB872]|uniref:hypothetical protein n=1 Tax=Salinivibrio sp. IB872 TaxID=1766123 RepID=UPI0013013856|nr:hypothetical protein [Salinivibrio sp. IB872]